MNRKKTARLPCPRCLKGGYRQEKASDGRPRFICTRCDYTWTCGKNGGEYAMSLKAERAA